MKKKRLLVLLPAVLMMLGSCDPADVPSSSSQPDDDTSSVVPVVEKGSVTITAAEHAKVVADKSECEVGKVVNFTITVDSGYELEFFKVNGTDVEVKNNKASAKMVAGGLTVTYGAKQITYGVTITSVEHVQVTADKTEAAAGDVVTFTVTPEENYELVSFKVNGLAREVKEGKATATMVKGGLTAVATVKTVTYGVTIDSNIVNGTVTADKSEAAEGEDVTFTITPDDDFTIATFKVNDADVAVVDGKATVKMVKQGLHATATFSANVHNVTIPSNIEHGTVTADKATAVKGEVVTFTVTADADYDLGYFKVNGVDVAVNDEGKATYTMAKEDLVVTVNFVEHYDLVSAIDDEFKAKVAALENIKYRLADNMSADQLPVASKVTVIDLNGKTLTITDASVLTANKTDQEVTVKNGKIVVAGAKTSNNFFQLLEGAKSLTLQNVEVSNDNEMKVSSAAFHTVGEGTLTLDGCTVNAKITYGISTNNLEGQSQTINVKDTKLNVTSEDGDNCAIILNVNGDGHVNIENSTITADRQAVIARTGEWSIKNSVLTNTGKFLAASEGNKTTNNNYLAGTWTTGNEVPSAPLIVGDTVTGAYKKDAKVTLEGVTGFSTGSDLIVARNDGTCATELNVDGLTYLNSYGKTDIGANVTTNISNVKTATIKEMNALTTADSKNLYKVHGYVKSITNANYGSGILIDDEGNKLVIYGGYTAESAAYYGCSSSGNYYLSTSSAKVIDSSYVGKEVTLIGTFDVYNTTKEIKNAIAFVEQSDATVTKEFDDTLGTVTLSKEADIKTGDEITVTATPIDGYKVASIKVTQYGETTDITEAGKFVAAAVNKVAVEFVEESAAVAQTYKLDLVKCEKKSVSGQTNSYANEWTTSSDGINYVAKNAGGQADSVRVGKKGTANVGSIANTTAFTNKIATVKIDFLAVDNNYVNSAKLYVASDSAFSTVLETQTFTAVANASTTITIETPTAGCFYKIEFDMKSCDKNGKVQMTAISFTEKL